MPTTAGPAAASAENAELQENSNPAAMDTRRGRSAAARVKLIISPSFLQREWSRLRMRLSHGNLSTSLF
jgi:hypothetical protein